MRQDLELLVGMDSPPDYAAPLYYYAISHGRSKLFCTHFYIMILWLVFYTQRNTLCTSLKGGMISYAYSQSSMLFDQCFLFSSAEIQLVLYRYSTAHYLSKIKLVSCLALGMFNMFEA